MVAPGIKFNCGRLERVLGPKRQAQTVRQPLVRGIISTLDRSHPMIQAIPAGKRRARIVLRSHKAHQLLLQSLGRLLIARHRARCRRGCRLPRCVLDRGRHDGMMMST